MNILKKISPWDVNWIDKSDQIALKVRGLVISNLSESIGSSPIRQALCTDYSKIDQNLRKFFKTKRFQSISMIDLPVY